YSQVVHQNTTVNWEIRAAFRNFEQEMDRKSSKLKGASSDDESPDDIVFKDYSEMYEWMRNGYIPLLWEEGPQGRGMLASRIRLVGGVRLARSRAQPFDCSEGAADKKWIDVIYNQSCFDADTAETKVVEDTYWLDISQNVSMALLHLAHLEDTGWITSDTLEISIQAFFFNAQSQNFVFSQVEVTLENSGYVHGDQEVMMIPSNVYSHQPQFLMSSTAADVFSGIGLAACLFVEAMMWRQAVKIMQLRAFMFNIYRLANLL
ncbi:pkd2, partial [Symbiodinium pilosum]